VQQTIDSGYIIAGALAYSGPGIPYVYLIKTDSLGDTLWTKVYDVGTGYSVKQASDGGFIITGVNFVNYNAYLVKTNSNGDTMWTRSYGSVGSFGFSVQETQDDGFVIAGCKFFYIDPHLHDYDVYLIKTDVNGRIVGVEESNDEYRTRNIEFRLYQNQPNPFSKLTAISYVIPAISSKRLAISEKIPVKLTIYDIIGRLEETLVDEVQEPGVYQVEWDGKDHSSGIYFYRLQIVDFISTKKLILLR
jgi:hypothetical protein